MGVPAFFRWITSRYSKIVLNVKDGNYEDTEVDNLYLDVNGIIHPCCAQTSGENAQFNLIFEYVDRLVGLVRPHKLLYIAIDGVAPRAKLCHQRTRRFVKAKDSCQVQEFKDKVTSTLQTSKETPNPLAFDSNVITPGTEFMANLEEAFQAYIQDRMASHPDFQGIDVIFSPSGDPGEGEHKILNYIRSQRVHAEYSPETVHCIYGGDADLILLGLTLHEPEVYVLREVAFYQGDAMQKPLQLLSIPSLRSCLALEFAALQGKKDKRKMQMEFDLDRIIDDYVFLTFFMGNDFVPRLPCLKIMDGGIDLLVDLYKYVCVNGLPDYLTSGGTLNFPALEFFFQHLSSLETRIHGKMGGGFSAYRGQSHRASDAREFVKGMVQKNRGLHKFSSKVEDLFCDFFGKLEDVSRKLHKNPDFQASDFGSDYYQKKFGLEAEDYPDFLPTIKRHYLAALVWVQHYYQSGCLSWNWYYPLHYAPQVNALLGCSDSVMNHPDFFQVGGPCKPIEQLFSVLPYQSAKVAGLPSCLSKYMNPKKFTSIVPYFPVNFTSDWNAMDKAWKAVVLIPYLPRETVDAFVEDLDLYKGDEALRHRNEVQSMLIFAYVGNTKIKSKKLRHLVRSNVKGILKSPEYFGNSEYVMARFEYSPFEMCTGPRSYPKTFPSKKRQHFSVTSMEDLKDAKRLKAFSGFSAIKLVAEEVVQLSQYQSALANVLEE